MAYSDIDSGKVLNKEGLLELCSQIKTEIANNSGGGSSYTAGNGIDIDANGAIKNNYQSIFGLMMLSNNISKSMNPYITSASGMTWEQFLSALQAGKIISTFNMNPTPTWINAGSKQLNATNVAGDANATYYICDLSAEPAFNFSTITARALASHIYFFDGTVLYTYGNSFQFLDWFNFNDGTNTTKKLGSLIRDINTRIPTAPPTDGSYKLISTVASGTPTYSWGTDSGGSGGGITYTAGTGISIENGVISLNLANAEEGTY